MAYPDSLTTITLTGRFVDGDTGLPAEGTITFVSSYLLQGPTDDAFVTPVNKTMRLIDGAFSVVLPATDDPDWTPQGFTYRVVLNTDCESQSWIISLPVSLAPTVDLADIAPVSTAPPVTMYVLASRVGTVGGPAGPLDANGKIPISQIPGGGGEGGAVDSVNGQTGIVILDAQDVGAEPTIAAGTTAQYWRGDKTFQTLNKAAVGLSNVDNTSDANKPISTATQAALNTKAPINNPTFTGTVSGITKAMVGLGNVDNTSDANKPVSTATQTALNGKAPVGKLHNGTAYVDSANVVLYVGPVDPGAVPDGAVWIDTSA